MLTGLDAQGRYMVLRDRIEIMPYDDRNRWIGRGRRLRKAQPGNRTRNEHVSSRTPTSVGRSECPRDAFFYRAKFDERLALHETELA